MNPIYAPFRLSYLLPIFALMATTTAITLENTASAFGPCCCFCQEGRCKVEVSVEQVEVKGFDVECDAICIPPLRFPWECGPLKKCGKVRCVKKLTTDKRTAKVCAYDWEAVLCCPNCRTRLQRRRCGGNPCGSGGSCESTCSASREPFCVSATIPQPQAFGDEYHRGSRNDNDRREGYPDVVVDPTVSIELVRAITNALPDQDGWVSVDRLPSHVQSADASLAAEAELIEARR